MELDFNYSSVASLTAAALRSGLPISVLVLKQQAQQMELPEEHIYEQMRKNYQVMADCIEPGCKQDLRSTSGLTGGSAYKMRQISESGKSLTGSFLSGALYRALAVSELNAAMGRIVAAPTAGSSGIVPGLLLALQEEYSIPDSRVIDALFNAGAIGYLAMRNATVAGAVGGCQAEVGVASAMAASAAVELMGGTAKQCLNAASSVLMNLLGLVCDPLGGLVECPCQGRNAAGAAVALTAAELALSGIRQLIPFDEMLAAMYRVGRQLSPDLRETALGGCAATPTGKALGCRACPCSP